MTFFIDKYVRTNESLVPNIGTPSAPTVKRGIGNILENVDSATLRDEKAYSVCEKKFRLGNWFIFRILL